MKRNLLIVLMLVLTLSSCGGRSGKKAGDGTRVSQKDKENASAIITYTNKLIDYLNETNGWLRSNESHMDDMVDMMETKRWQNIMPEIPKPMLSSYDKGLDTPPSAMDKEDQAYFKDAIGEYRRQFTALQETCRTLFKYIRTQDYKDDDYAKGKELAAEITGYYNFVTETKSEMFYRIDNITENAERILLSDHPLRDPIFTLKAEIADFEEMYSVFYAYDEGEATAADVEEAYNRVAASVETHKSMYKDILEENGVQDDWDDFYEECEDALGRCRMALRRVRDGRKIDSSDLRSFSTNYNYIISAYNRFDA